MTVKDEQELNLIEGSLWNKLLIIAIPMALTSILQQLFNAADIAVVGNFIEDPNVAKAAVAAVGSNTPIVSLIVSLFVGLSIGTNVIIAQEIGQRNRGNIRKAVSTSVIISLIGGLIITVGGELIVNYLMIMMSVPEDVISLASVYLQIYFLGMPAIFLYNFETAIYRSIGNTKTPLIVLIFSGILNIILNLIFVIFFKMDVSGVALATILSNIFSAIILFVLLCKTDEDIKIDLSDFHYDQNSFNEIMKIGLPAGVQGMIFSVANICIQTAINSLGTEVMAGSAAAMNLELFSYYIMAAFGQTCTTLVGQNFGAGKYERCQLSLKESLLFSFIAYILILVTLLSFGPNLLSFFNSDTDVIANGMIRLRYMLMGHFFSVGIEVLSGYLRGFGVSTSPAVCTLIFVCGIRIIWVYIIFPIYRSFTFLMLVYPLSLCLNFLSILVVYLYVRRKLKTETIEMAETVGS